MIDFTHDHMKLVEPMSIERVWPVLSSTFQSRVCINSACKTFSCFQSEIQSNAIEVSSGLRWSSKLVDQTILSVKHTYVIFMLLFSSVIKFTVGANCSRALQLINFVAFSSVAIDCFIRQMRFHASQYTDYSTFYVHFCFINQLCFISFQLFWSK